MYWETRIACNDSPIGNRYLDERILANARIGSQDWER